MLIFWLLNCHKSDMGMIHEDMPLETLQLGREDTQAYGETSGERR